MKILLLIFILLQTLSYAKSNELTKVKLQLQWKYQFQFAGFIMAKELGYYKDVGLDVELIEYKNTPIMQDLLDNKVDYALTNSIISYKDKSLRDVTLVATYFQKSPLILITQKDIKSIMDVKDKIIMMSQDNKTNSSLSILLEYFNINSQNNTFLPPSFNLNDFIEKKVDIITGFRSNELFLLDKQNVPYNVLDPVEYGFSTNAINLFVAHTKTNTNPQEIEDFLSATKKGWIYALQNIPEVAKLIHEKYQPHKSIEHLIYEGKITKNLMLLNLYDIGEVNKNFVIRTYNKLIKDNRLYKNQSPDKLFLKRENLQQWIQQQYIQRTEYTFALMIAGFAIFLIMLMLFWLFRIKKEIKKRVLAEVRLKHQAEHDALTKLPNRILFLDRLKQAIKDAQREEALVGVLYIDLDNFKEINDSLGHSIGDMVLLELAKRLSNSLRHSDTVARVGGDEFIIIINNFTQEIQLTHLLQKLEDTLQEAVAIQNHQLYLTLSIGISIYPHDALDPDTLVKNADTAMYKAKDSGKNKYQFYTSGMSEQIYQRILLETQLREAIQNNELEVYYQLQRDTQQEKIIGMEALVRWNHPQKGLIPPIDFIPLAEENGLIVAIDTWVMRESVKQFQKWIELGLEPGVLSLNLSMLRLEKGDFHQDIVTLLEQACIDANYLSFELTETQIMTNPEQSIKSLKAISSLGIKLSIDDFGTGYSSLSYLKKLPINKLKIDQSFIRDIPKDKDDEEITKTIISMAKNLNLKVIAEGVETQEQEDFLYENGCYEIQGYLYHKPEPADKIEKKLQTTIK